MTVDVADFVRLWGDLPALRHLVVARLECDPQQVVQWSRETTTHYKWMLASDRVEGTKVWLHEFKPASERRPGYAASVHNHRYPFTAIAVAGGYSNVRYDVGFDPGSLRVERCDVIDLRRIREGLSYSMTPEEYHAVDDIEDGTKTLIMEFAAVSATSFSYDLTGDQMTRHVTLEARLESLLRPSAQLVDSSLGLLS